MADDMIDIEEHDVMENPMIRQIFPDLSVLKKEIIDYNDDIQEDLLKSDMDCSDGTDHMFHTTLNRSSSDKYWKSPYNNNRIILGSKRNRNITPKVYLQNVSHELKKSKKFCKTCSILFSTKEALFKHQMLHHNNMGHEETSFRQSDNVENSIKQKEMPYSNRWTLKNHENNFVNTTNEVECTPQNRISDVNVMVKINEAHINNIDNNELKPCFHCNDVFPSRQLLIDHLYEILNTKNSNLQSVKNKNNNDVVFCKNNEILQNPSFHRERTEPELKRDSMQNNKLYYCCPICSYYILEEKDYKKHLLSNHNISKKNYIERFEFCSKCKICQFKYCSVSSYNKHLRIKHKNIIMKTNNNDYLSFTKNQELYKQSNNLELPCKKNTHQIDICKRYTKILPENLKSNEDRMFEKRFKEVRIMILQTILFQCTECNIHFLTSEVAGNHVLHSELLQDWKCLKCQKLFKQDQQNLHEKQHSYSNYFTVVEVNPQVLEKCPKCSRYFSKENFTDHQCNCVLEQLDMYNTASNVVIQHDYELDSNQKIDSDPDCTIIDHEKCDTIEKLNNTKKNSIMVTLKKKRKPIYYFCNVCKCNIRKANMEDHLQSSCTNLIKKVCEFCGLVFCNDTINSHKRLHQKYNKLKLQDFTIFDLRNKIKIKPISDLPKCGSCEKHFINEHEVVHHYCGENNCIICPVCKIKLTDSAFKLHEPFHSYKLKGENQSKQANDLIYSNTDSSIAEDMNYDQNLLTSFGSETNHVDEVLYLYTCKNCDISMNMYDDVVEHCHSHIHLNKMDIDGMECAICNVYLTPSSFDRHQQLHLTYSKEKFKYLNFDVLYFSVHKDAWVSHVFGTLPKDTINRIMEQSIYRYENKIKLQIIQDGPYKLTIYKCDKCKCFMNGKSIYEHTVNCSNNSEKFHCRLCKTPFISNISRIEHENNHLNLQFTLKSYRIVIFNQKQDKITNHNISKLKYYVLFECRFCHIVVDRNIYNKHKCNSFNCKSCNICGLLFEERDYDDHMLKHKVINSFKKDVMKVVLIGNKNVNGKAVKINNLISTFSGMVCDYTFYKCVNCNVCIREFRKTSQHYCLIDVAKFECPQCDLIFDEGKMKGHLKLHDTDPDFTKDTILVKTFNCNKINKREYCKINNKSIKIDNFKDELKVPNADFGGNDVCNDICIPEVVVKIYKCLCGLHFLNETQLKEHLTKCSGIVRNKLSRQACVKCGLSFTSNILFKHLLEHHGEKNVVYKYDIVENFNNGTTFSL